MWSVGMANRLCVGGSWVRMSVGASFLQSPNRPDQLRDQPSLLFNRHLGSFSGVKQPGCEFKHLLLVSKLRISAAVSRLPLYFFT
jgi:hypothetical protein